MLDVWVIYTTFLIFIVFLLLGQKVSSLLITIGLIGILFIGGPSLASSFLKNDPYLRVASYSLTPIPLFVLMAQFILQARIVNDLYHLIYKLSRGSAGLLGVFTIFLGGLLGSVSGSGTATAAAMGQVASPELVKRGYDKYLAGAIAAASGSLSAIVPPSIILIIYGAITQTSISTMFIAAVIPSIGIILIYSIYAIYLLKKSNISDFDNSSINIDKDKIQDEIEPGLFRYFVAVLSCGLIAFSIFGGIYYGVFTPTEAAAAGCVVSFLTALSLKTVNKEFVVKSMRETINITAMVLLIMVGAQIFSRFLSLSRLPHNLVEYMLNFGHMPFLILLIILALCFVLFMFIEGSAVIVMAVPVMLPLVVNIGYDPVWFGVALCVLCSSGLLTPPVGLSVYAVSGVSGLKIDGLFRVSTMFAFLVMVVLGTFMIWFPEMVSYLPNKMR